MHPAQQAAAAKTIPQVWIGLIAKAGPLGTHQSGRV